MSGPRIDHLVQRPYISLDAAAPPVLIAFGVALRLRCAPDGIEIALWLSLARKYFSNRYDVFAEIANQRLKELERK